MNQNTIEATFCSTFKWGLFPERGILRVDTKGLQYIRILKSWAVIGISLAASAVWIGLLFWAIGRGEFLGLPSTLLFLVVVIAPAVFVVKSFLHKRALSLEELFLQSEGTGNLPTQFSLLLRVPWSEVKKLRIGTKSPFSVSAYTSRGTSSFGVVVGGSQLSKFPHKDNAAAAKALRSAVAALAPSVLES